MRQRGGLEMQVGSRDAREIDRRDAGPTCPRTRRCRRVVIRRPGWTASLTGAVRSPKNEAVASMSATTYVIPQRVDGPSLAVSGEPTTSTITSPNRKKIWRIGRPPSSASRSRRGSTPTAASDSTVRSRSGDSSTTWSIAVTPFACVAGVASAASDLVVGTPSRSSSDPSDGRPRSDHPTMPVPRSRPTSRMPTSPIRQTESASNTEPGSRPGVRWIGDVELVDGDGHGCGPYYLSEPDGNRLDSVREHISRTGSSSMSLYAVVDPATGDVVKEYPTGHRRADGAGAGVGQSRRTGSGRRSRRWTSAST